MATRLLDWTESLLGAAFFASGKAGRHGEASIYGVSGLPVLNHVECNDPFAVERVYIYCPAHIDSKSRDSAAYLPCIPIPPSPSPTQA